LYYEPVEENLQASNYRDRDFNVAPRLLKSRGSLFFLDQRLIDAHAGADPSNCRRRRRRRLRLGIRLRAIRVCCLRKRASSSNHSHGAYVGQKTAGLPLQASDLPFDRTHMQLFLLLASKVFRRTRKSYLLFQSFIVSAQRLTIGSSTACL